MSDSMFSKEKKNECYLGTQNVAHGYMNIKLYISKLIENKKEDSNSKIW